MQLCVPLVWSADCACCCVICRLCHSHCVIWRIWLYWSHCAICKLCHTHCNPAAWSAVTHQSLDLQPFCQFTDWSAWFADCAKFTNYREHSDDNMELSEYFLRSSTKPQSGHGSASIKLLSVCTRSCMLFFVVSTAFWLSQCQMLAWVTASVELGIQPSENIKMGGG